MKGFTKLSPHDITDNVFSSIGRDWMLITSGDQTGYNTMTASWGGLGVLWNKNVALCFVRPQRYTFEFTEKNELLTLSFFDAKYKDALKVCGAKSGRDIDKAKETGLTPCFVDGTTTFSEASLVLVCKKLYTDWLKKENFLDKAPLSMYPADDFHKIYINEIVCVYTSNKIQQNS